MGLIRTGIQAKKWSQAVGEVKQVDLKEIRYKRTHYIVNVKYTYRVGADRYEGSVIHPAYDASMAEGNHRKIEEMLKCGRKVCVYYNQIKPEQSTLVVGFFSSTLSQIVGGVLFVLFGLLLVLLFGLFALGNANFASGINIIQ